MRAKPLLLTIAIATATLAAAPASAQTAPVAAVPPAAAPAAAVPAAAPDDEVVRSMYIMTGAMAGYMFAVMPVTMSAVTAAVASGAFSMWAYDYMLGPAAKANQAAGR